MSLAAGPAILRTLDQPWTLAALLICALMASPPCHLSVESTIPHSFSQTYSSLSLFDSHFLASVTPSLSAKFTTITIHNSLTSHSWLRTHLFTNSSYHIEKNEPQLLLFASYVRRRWRYKLDIIIIFHIWVTIVGLVVLVSLTPCHRACNTRNKWLITFRVMSIQQSEPGSS